MVFGTIKINNYSPLSLNKRFFFLLIQSNQNSLSFIYIHNSYICSEGRQSSQSLLIGIVVTSANEQSKSKQWPTYALSFLIQLFKLWNIFYQTTEMYSRPLHNKKRYRTEADEFNTDVNRNYNNSTLPDSKLHQNPFETLNQISVPTVAPPRLAAYKLPSHLMSIHQRFHLHKNPLKKLSDINFQSCIKKEQVVPRNNNGPLVFKKNNPLFVVNTLMDILKEDSNEKKLTSCPKKLKEQKSTQYNQFSEFEGRAKPQRGPRLVEAQLNLLAQQNYVFSRRKIYSEQKSRQKINMQPAELVTFYKPKPQGTVNNEFWV